MKTLRIALISFVAAASGAATFAGPGPQYWAARRAEQTAKKTESAQVSVSKDKAGTSSDSTNGKQGEPANAMKCKTACCS
jgi:hypothetical protein